MERVEFNFLYVYFTMVLLKGGLLLKQQKNAFKFKIMIILVARQRGLNIVTTDGTVGVSNLFLVKAQGDHNLVESYYSEIINVHIHFIHSCFLSVVFSSGQMMALRLFYFIMTDLKIYKALES